MILAMSNTSQTVKDARAFIEAATASGESSMASVEVGMLKVTEASPGADASTTMGDCTVTGATSGGRTEEPSLPRSLCMERRRAR